MQGASRASSSQRTCSDSRRRPRGPDRTGRSFPCRRCGTSRLALRTSESTGRGRTRRQQVPRRGRSSCELQVLREEAAAVARGRAPAQEPWALRSRAGSSNHHRRWEARRSRRDWARHSPEEVPPRRPAEAVRRSRTDSTPQEPPSQQRGPEAAPRIQSRTGCCRCWPAPRNRTDSRSTLEPPQQAPEHSTSRSRTATEQQPPEPLHPDPEEAADRPDRTGTETDSPAPSAQEAPQRWEEPQPRPSSPAAGGDTAGIGREPPSPSRACRRWRTRRSTSDRRCAWGGGR